MLFTVDRASGGCDKYDRDSRSWLRDNKPCKSAFPDPSDDSKWLVKIDNIEDLVALTDEIDEDLIFGKSCITIYDDYVE